MAIAIIGRGGMGTALARRFEDAGEKTTLLGRRGSVPKDAGTIFLVVPHGVEHRTAADEEAEIVLFEPAATRNTGDAAPSDFTAPAGVRI